MANSKNQLFQKRRLRVRNKLRKSAGDRPRLCVNRSNKNISAQLIDDARGVTIAAASSLEKGLGVVKCLELEKNRLSCLQELRQL